MDVACSFSSETNLLLWGVCHCRRSKYNRKVLEYWVDTKTIGKFTATESEEIKDSTIAEGKADGFVLGLEPGEPSDPYRGASDDEDDDDAESSEDEGASKKGKGKGNGGRKLPKAEVQEERALEAGVCEPYKPYINPKPYTNPINPINPKLSFV